MITAIEEHWFYQKWQPAENSHAHDRLQELVTNYATFAAMSAKTADYSERMAVIRPRLTVTVDSDPVQLAADRGLYAAISDVWDCCYKEEVKSREEAKAQEIALGSLNAELDGYRSRIDFVADKVKTGDANTHHLSGARQQWTNALRTILGRQPGDFA